VHCEGWPEGLVPFGELAQNLDFFSQVAGFGFVHGPGFGGAGQAEPEQDAKERAERQCQPSQASKIRICGLQRRFPQKRQ
jgi:hypothetical protein